MTEEKITLKHITNFWNIEYMKLVETDIWNYPSDPRWSKEIKRLQNMAWKNVFCMQDFLGWLDDPDDWSREQFELYYPDEVLDEDFVIKQHNERKITQKEFWEKYDNATK